jgi:hypothetical protein
MPLRLVGSYRGSFTHQGQKNIQNYGQTLKSSLEIPLDGVPKAILEVSSRAGHSSVHKVQLYEIELLDFHCRYFNSAIFDEYRVPRHSRRALDQLYQTCFIKSGLVS